jgi:NADH-quinone oxidoreductase subunit E
VRERVSGVSQPVADRRMVREVLDRHADERGAVIPVLQDLQRTFGYLPRPALRYAARRLRRPVSELIGVATFYSQFRFTPVGRHIIRVCHGTACHVAGAQHISQVIHDELGVDEGDTTSDGLFTVEHVACLGCCSLAPVMMIDETTYGRLDRQVVRKILDRYRGEEAK